MPFNLPSASRRGRIATIPSCFGRLIVTRLPPSPASLGLPSSRLVTAATECRGSNPGWVGQDALCHGNKKTHPSRPPNFCRRLSACPLLQRAHETHMHLPSQSIGPSPSLPAVVVLQALMHARSHRKSLSALGVMGMRRSAFFLHSLGVGNRRGSSARGSGFVVWVSPSL
jgi:hypothetical protein